MAGRLDPYVIRTKALVREFIIAVSVGFGLECDSRFCILERHGSPGYGAAARIANRAEDGPCLELGEQKGREDEETHREGERLQSAIEKHRCKSNP